MNPFRRVHVQDGYLTFRSRIIIVSWLVWNVSRRMWAETGTVRLGLNDSMEVNYRVNLNGPKPALAPEPKKWTGTGVAVLSGG